MYVYLVAVEEGEYWQQWIRSSCTTCESFPQHDIVKHANFLSVTTTTTATMRDSSATRIRRALLQHRTLSRHPHTHTRIGIDTHTIIGKLKSECLYVFSVYTGSGRRRLGERVRSDGQESTDDVASPEARSCFHRP